MVYVVRTHPFSAVYYSLFDFKPITQPFMTVFLSIKWE